MKKILFIPISLTLVLPAMSAISCSSSSSDYYVMPWDIDRDKINKLKENGWESFNNESTSIDKLKKITKGNVSDHITIEAFDKGWFDSIKFEIKNNKPTKLVIKLIKEKNTSDNKKTIKNPYRLPNGSLTWSI